MNRTVRQVRIVGRDKLEVGNHEIGPPAAGEVVVQTVRAGICGSDLHALERGHPWFDYPISPGHEVSGIVLDGDGSEWPPGERVWVDPLVSCGTCDYCRSGRTNLCVRRVGIGAHGSGGMADAFRVPSTALHRLSPGVSFGAAAMIEPLACAMHAVGLAPTVRNQTVVVIGAGTVGQCVLLAARQEGVGEVIITDRFEAKLEVARQLGADAVVPAEGEPSALSSQLRGSAAVVFDCVASEATINTSLSLLGRGGTLVIVGQVRGTANLPLEALQDDERTIKASSMYTRAEIAAAAGLVTDGVPVDRLITADFPISDAAEAFRAAVTGANIKVQLSAAENRIATATPV